MGMGRNKPVDAIKRDRRLKEISSGMAEKLRDSAKLSKSARQEQSSALEPCPNENPDQGPMISNARLVRLGVQAVASMCVST
jgi:hypothetical protein